MFTIEPSKLPWFVDGEYWIILLYMGVTIHDENPY